MQMLNSFLRPSHEGSSSQVCRPNSTRPRAEQPSYPGRSFVLTKAAKTIKEEQVLHEPLAYFQQLSRMTSTGVSETRQGTRKHKHFFNQVKKQ